MISISVLPNLTFNLRDDPKAPKVAANPKENPHMTAISPAVIVTVNDVVATVNPIADTPVATPAALAPPVKGIAIALANAIAPPLITAVFVIFFFYYTALKIELHTRLEPLSGTVWPLALFPTQPCLLLL